MNACFIFFSVGPFRQVQFDEAHQYAEDNGLIHMETSAKSAQNVKSIFVEIGEFAWCYVFFRRARRVCLSRARSRARTRYLFSWADWREGMKLLLAAS